MAHPSGLHLPAQQTALVDHQHPPELTAGSVGTLELEDLSVTNAKLAANAVTPSKFDSTVYGTGTVALVPDAATSHGVSTALARTDHGHQLTAGTAITLTGVNGEGSASTVARSDHDHAIPATEAAEVTTAQTTTSGTFTDLATSGPAVTVTVPASGKVRVTIYCSHTAGGTGDIALMSYAMSGANTNVARDGRSVGHVGNTGHRNGATFYEGINPGSTTFTAKYRSTTGVTATFSDRHITVEPVLS